VLSGEGIAVNDDRTRPADPVYHDTLSPADGEDAPLRAFYIDVFADEDSDATEHAFYGAVSPRGGAIAKAYDGRSICSLVDPERFAARIGGWVVWV
jgi:hypothetical protein